MTAPEMDDFSDLCRVLGGSSDSWTGHFLLLVRKSDPAHKALLRRADPRLVVASELWDDGGYAMTEADFLTELNGKVWG